MMAFSRSAGGDAQRPVFDVEMLLFLAGGRDAHGVALVALGQRGDRARHGGRKHQRAALGRGGVEDEFEVLAKAEIEHLVGLVEHHGLQRRHVERVRRDVVAQAAGRADDDMGAALQRAPFGAHVHAADAGGDRGAGQFVEPFQFARHLHGEFARRRDGQRQRRARPGRSARRRQAGSAPSARPKATVLPEPVCAETSASASPSGARTAFCTGVSSE